jgi:hypothetical protein
MADISPAPGVKYALKIRSSGYYLDGRSESEKEVWVTHRDPIGDPVLNWTIESMGDGYYALKVCSSGYYLDGRNESEKEVWVTNRNPKGDPVLNWAFIPTSYKLKAVMSDFEYTTDIQKVLNSNKKSDFMGEYEISVGKDTVGSSISRTFQKTISSTFSWGLNQKISYTTSLEINADIPLIGGVKTTVSMGAEIGSSQDWSSRKDISFSATDVLKPEIPGLYKMSGWIETAENVELPFKAQVVFTATGDNNAKLDNKAIEYLLKFEEFNGTIIARNPSDIVVSITGTMKGSYGMTTFTKTEKIE